MVDMSERGTKPAGTLGERCSDYSIAARRKGSISAEHGIGSLKRPFLHYSRSPEELALMRAIKQAMDPNGILNPGKVI